MRIISGIYKGKKILFHKNNNTRPLRDMVKENIFNILIHSKLLSNGFLNLRILDLFAGFGSFGLECISRGATNVIFVEKDLKTFNILQKNLASFKYLDKAETFLIDAIEYLNKEKKTFDIIFLDPPYNYRGEILKIHNIVSRKKLLNKKSLLILHRENEDINLLEKFRLLDSRNYGRSKIFFYEMS